MSLTAVTVHAGSVPVVLKSWDQLFHCSFSAKVLLSNGSFELALPVETRSDEHAQFGAKQIVLIG